MVSLHSRLFDGPPPPELRRDNTALVVVDMQYFDASPDWGEGLTAKQLGVDGYFDEYFRRIDEIIPRIQKLLAAARQSGVEVIHLRVSELTEDSRDVGRKQAVRGLFVPRSSKEACLLDEVAAEGDEIVISKSSSGVFAWTNLDRLLQTMGIENLVFTGTATSGCIESAVKDAADLGYRSLIVDDACASGTMRDHDAAIRRMDGGPNRIVQTVEMLDDIESLGSESAPSRMTALAEFLAKPVEGASGGGPDNPYAAIFGAPPRAELRPDRTALLVMDMQRFTADPAGGLASRARERGAWAEMEGYFDKSAKIRESVVNLVAGCRAAGVQVIHTRLAEHAAGRDAGPRQRAYGLSIPANSPDAAFVDGLEPVAGDLVLDRSGAGAFVTTNIDRLLRNMGARTLIIAGTSFDGGIEATARSAADRDYDVVLVEDGCAMFWVTGELRRMQAGLTTVMSSAEIIGALAAQRD